MALLLNLTPQKPRLFLPCTCFYIKRVILEKEKKKWKLKKKRTMVLTYNVARNESEKLWVSLGWVTDFTITLVFTSTHTHTCSFV